jgi:outer membrane receptor protein involved in Fe transport
MRILLLYFFTFFSTFSAWSQILGGKVIDKETRQGIPYASITWRGGAHTTDSSGIFKIDLKGVKTLQIVAMDYQELTYTINSVAVTEVTIELESAAKGVGQVTISHNRLKEKLRESPVTVESLNAKAIKETPASDFYEGLGHLRGVDVTAASLGFRIVNTRGFNSTSPVRSLQLIDGVDNQAPGLNFSLGNFLGANELDVANTEIVVGASSAYYGPNAFNGVINMTTKDPWKHQGLTAQIKVGERELAQIMLRYAKVYKNKKGREVFAFKTGLSYMRAYDWVADNYDPTLDSKAGRNNPGGYDAVNRYGDEVFGTAANDQVSMESRRRTPGLGAFYRDGYYEKDLVDYNTRNLKTNIVLAYKINNRNEIQYGFNFGTGTTVYQGDNRYSLNDILFFQNRLEWLGKKGHLRLYATHEDAGKTYDAVLAAFLMQGKSKPGEYWFSDYQNYWLNNMTNKVKNLPGYNQLGTFIAGLPNYNPNWASDQDKLLQKYSDSLIRWHAQTRAQANRATNYQGLSYPDPYLDRLVPGTPEFEAKKKEITETYSYSREGGPTGARFFDKSALYHLTGERRFTLRQWKFTTGFSARMYAPNSNGTIFLDTGNARITNTEAGAYAGFERRLWSNRWKINATARVDKNQNFPFLFSPAASIIYSKDKRNTWRGSFSSAIRNPTLQDQFLYYNVGRAILLGNKDGIKNVVTVDNFIDYLNTPNLNRDTLKPFNIDPIRPESVKTGEIGYKGILLNGKLMVDAGYYLSYYTNFIGYRVVVDVAFDTFSPFPKAQAYRVASNSRDVVSTQGFSAGANYFFAKCFMVGGNWSWNVLDRRGSTDALIPAFNTPRHKFNVTFGASDMKKSFTFLGKDIAVNNVGFNINFKFVEGYRFEGSPQFTGDVPSYWMLDAQFNKVIPKWKSTLKIGASNLTNNMVFQVYGGPRIGRMAYISLTYEP